MNDLFVWLSNAYSAAYLWYMGKRRPYRLVARILRMIAMASLTMTILWPAFQLVKWAGPIATACGITDAAQFGYLTAAIGGVAMMLDKLGGFSLAWVRHSRTAMALFQGYDELQCAWAIAVMNPAAEQAKRQDVIHRSLEVGRHPGRNGRLVSGLSHSAGYA